MKRAYYEANIAEFIQHDNRLILGELSKNNQHHDLVKNQVNAWTQQIKLLKQQLSDLDGYIYFEFSIPRMGKRVDNIVIIGNTVCLIEFKIGSEQYNKEDVYQVIDYALDLRNFHEGSHQARLLPILIATKAQTVIDNNICAAMHLDKAILSNGRDLGAFLKQFQESSLMDVQKWATSRYKPTPTIIEAAQALYQNHDVKEITRSDAGAENLSKTTNCISQIIEQTKAQRKKAICFVTGVPGAGKTLAGLNIANQRLQTAEDEHAVFLSGNGPLVKVLQEALARNTQNKNKKEALQQAKAFIQNIHHFRDEYLESPKAPIEKVVIFDEAQRAWNEQQTSKFMQQKRGKIDFHQSEPDFLIEVMNRHQDWCVIICLIGGGQEINTGEAGLEAWIQAIKSSYPDWIIHYSYSIINESAYLNNSAIKKWLPEHAQAQPDLHLATSVRSFRSEKVSAFVQALLDFDSNAKNIYQNIQEKYPIVVTRDLSKAKAWLVKQAKGNERSGLIASSGARRLKALGVNVKNEIDVAHWFLNPKDDVRSSYFLEDVATEFEVQGLELDWVCMAWGANFYYQNKNMAWNYQTFKGSKWQNIHKPEDQIHTKNAYRVLLTRARQGMVIWIPKGDKNDKTRQAAFYDGTYEYLVSLGIIELH